MVCISVCAVTDSPTSDETGLAAEEVCSIGIPIYVQFVNFFTAVEELWKGFETAKALPWVAFLGCLCNFFGSKSMGRVDLFI